MVRLSDQELARLDELRPPDVKRATFMRSLLQEPPTGDEVATRTEALAILTRLARDGRVTAAIAIARELRDERLEPDGEMARFFAMADYCEHGFADPTSCAQCAQCARSSAPAARRSVYEARDLITTGEPEQWVDVGELGRLDFSEVGWQPLGEFLWRR